MTACSPDARAVPGRLTPEPVINWATLSPGDKVEIHRQGRAVTAGRIDMRAPDGSVIWVIRDGGEGRALFLQGDGATLFRRARRHIAGAGRSRVSSQPRRS
jgi:hypothetical protein